MNYFELFDIPVQLKVNTALLSKRFFELSRQYHPDFMANESEEMKAEALQTSALINKAWKTFQQPDATIRYVLMEKGLLEEEEKYQLSPEFLMEVMDINEQLMDAGDDPGLREKLINSTSELEKEIYAPVKKNVEDYQDGIVSKEELLQVKDYYFKKKYLQRIRQQLAGKA